MKEKTVEWNASSLDKERMRLVRMTGRDITSTITFHLRGQVCFVNTKCVHIEVLRDCRDLCCQQEDASPHVLYNYCFELTWVFTFRLFTLRFRSHILTYTCPFQCEQVYLQQPELLEVHNTGVKTELLSTSIMSMRYLRTFLASTNHGASRVNLVSLAMFH